MMTGRHIRMENFIYFCLVATFEVVKRYSHEDFSLEIIKILKAKYNCNNEIAESLFRPVYFYLCINTNVLTYNYDFKKWEIDNYYKELDEKKIKELINGIKKKYESILFYKTMFLK